MKTIKASVKIAVLVPPSTMIKRHVTNAAMANIKMKTIKLVVKLAMLDIFPTLLKLDVPDVLQVNTPAVEVVKIVIVDNTKMKMIKATVNLIATPALPLIQRKRPATYATLVNTKTTTTK